MIGLSPITSSSDTVIIKESGKSALDNVESRISAIQCLDGTTAVTHSGVSYGDEEFIVYSSISEAEYAIIDRLQRNHTTLTIATSRGLFSGMVKSKSFKTGQLTLKLKIVERLDV